MMRRSGESAERLNATPNSKFTDGDSSDSGEITKMKASVCLSAFSMSVAQSVPAVCESSDQTVKPCSFNAFTISRTIDASLREYDTNTRVFVLSIAAPHTPNSAFQLFKIGV